MIKIAINAHKPVHTGEPRGGEKSVKIVAEFLSTCGHDVRFYHPAEKEMSSRGVRYINRSMSFSDMEGADVVLTWGSAAPYTATWSRFVTGTKYILMVRWWRNLLPDQFLSDGPGDMLTREMHSEYNNFMRPVFEGAAAIVTNSLHAREVIRRFHPYCAEVHVSRVPVYRPLSASFSRPTPGGPILIVSDCRGLGEPAFIRAIARRRPDLDFVVVNATETYSEKNVIAVPYQNDLSGYYRGASFVLVPVYHNDTCGGGRVCVEANVHGTPCIGNDRSGFSEQGGLCVSRDASIDEWSHKIDEVTADYESAFANALRNFSAYDTPGQLRVFSDLIESI